MQELRNREESEEKELLELLDMDQVEVGGSEINAPVAPKKVEMKERIKEIRRKIRWQRIKIACIIELLIRFSLEYRQRMKKEGKPGWMFCVLIAIFAGLCITGMVFVLQPEPLIVAIGAIAQQPILFLLNFLPPLVLLVFCWIAFNNVFYGASFSCLIFGLLSYINNLKVQYRNDPLIPRDFVMLREALGSASSYRLEIEWGLLFFFIGLTLLFFLFGFFFSGPRMPVNVREGGVISVILVAVLLNIYVYSSRDIYFDDLEKSNVANVAEVYAELGFTYCFLFNFSAYPIEKPTNFSKEAVKEWNEEVVAASWDATTSAELNVRPHIILVMNEAFYDITNEDAFVYPESRDPLIDYNTLKKDEHVISGNIVVPNFGGGTANTEFDVLTGMQTNMISSTPPSAFRIVRKETESMASVLKKRGYQTLFLHPGKSWFYNRENVYRHFGIEDQIFEDEFTEEDYKGTNRLWIKDDACADMLIDSFEERTKNSDAPLFTYAVTIENHMTYERYKFGDIHLPHLETFADLSDEGEDILRVYLEGLKDSSAMLKKLTDYFSDISEPVILAFYGDHLPYLGKDYLAYRELGIPIGSGETIEENLKMYAPPYLIWSNQSAREALDWKKSSQALGLPRNGEISANYLGAIILELAGYQKISPYFDFLNEARRKLPVIWKNQYMDQEGVYTKTLTEEQEQIVDRMRCWEYYKLKYE